MDTARVTPLRLGLSAARGALFPVGLFSMVFNLLGLVVPLYMMQIYDRVLASGSRETLLWLTLMALGVLLVMALLDASRSAIAVRVSGWLEERLAPQAFARAVETALRQRDYNTEALRDLSTVRNALGGAALFILFDALWAPAYLAV